MKVWDSRDCYTVRVSAREVMEFAARWPCSGLRERAVTFQFQKSNGDLVDTNDSTTQPRADGGAMLAMSEDAGRHGAKKLGLDLGWRYSEPVGPAS